MATNWLYSVDGEGVRITPEFMKLLRSGNVAALRSLQKRDLTTLYRKGFSRAPRRDDAHGFFWSDIPETALIPLVRAARHSPPAWVKAEVIAETVAAKNNTYEPPKLIERSKKRVTSLAKSMQAGIKRGEESVLVNITGGSVSAWKMMPNPKFELVVVNRFDKAALLKLLDELDGADNVERWLTERTNRRGATAHKSLYLDYKAWCERLGETAAGTKKFAQALISAGVVKLTRSNAAQRYELELLA